MVSSDQWSRAKRAAEEPQCAALKEENAELTAKLISKKAVQVAMAGEIDSLKKEKAVLSRQKVSSFDYTTYL